MMNTFYRPMGLRTMGYNPLERMDLREIAPTEYDKSFRQQLVHGYVHDPGSAMMGGVGGHAGIFCDVNDLSISMQMLLNKREKYGGVKYLQPETIEKSQQSIPGNNRRAGLINTRETLGRNLFR